MKNIKISKNSKRGFTLIELLIVIAILALLMSIIIITLNPAELLKKTRDVKRISDLNALRTALNLYVTDKASPDLDAWPSGVCTTNRWYSLSGVGPTGNCTAMATAFCTTTPRFTTGFGWVPVNFGAISSGSPLSALPVDPTNATSTTATANLYYAYGCDSTAVTFELNAQMESTYYKAGGDGDVVGTDGGNNATLYEVGSDPGLDLMSAIEAGFFSP